MNIENQVVSLELSKKLKKLGARQESLYWYVSCQSSGEPVSNWHGGVWTQKEIQELRALRGAYKVSAFTCAELISRMPEEIQTDKGKSRWYLTITKDNVGYANLYRYEQKSGCFYLHNMTHFNGTLVDKIAKMLIYLLENKLIKKELLK